MDTTSQIGVTETCHFFQRQLGWTFREQTKDDWGVDAQVEIWVEGAPTNRLIALQIKSGPSYFRRRHKNGSGWWVNLADRHVQYWCDGSLPTILVIRDLETNRGYWQVVARDTVEPTDAGRWKILIPQTQLLDRTVRDTFEKLARTPAATPSGPHAPPNGLPPAGAPPNPYLPSGPDVPPRTSDASAGDRRPWNSSLREHFEAVRKLSKTRPCDAFAQYKKYLDRGHGNWRPLIYEEGRLDSAREAISWFFKGKNLDNDLRLSRSKPLLRADALTCAGYYLREAGEHQAALVMFDRCKQELEKANAAIFPVGTNEHKLHVITLRHLADTHYYLGELDLAKRHNEACLGHYKNKQKDEYYIHAITSRALMAFRLAKYDVALTCFDEATELQRRIHGRRWLQGWRGVSHALCLCRRGRLREAQRILENNRLDPDSTRQHRMRCLWNCVAGNLAAKRGDEKIAREKFETALEAAKAIRPESIVERLEVLRCYGSWSGVVMRCFDEGDGMLRDAAALAEKYPIHRPDIARGRALIARARFQDPRSGFEVLDDAMGGLEEAIQCGRKVGDVRTVTLAEQDLEELRALRSQTRAALSAVRLRRGVTTRHLVASWPAGL